MDYTKRAAIFCCTCLLTLVAVSFIPPQSIWGVELRRANILSEIIPFDKSHTTETDEVTLTLDESEYEVDLEEVSEVVGAISNEIIEENRSFSWSNSEEIYTDIDSLERVYIPAGRDRVFSHRLPSIELTPIEDYDTTESGALRRLYRKLIEGDSLVRIALLGDSFVEADILSADLRESLQSEFGGSGAGFAPAASPLTLYRQTIKTSSKGWDSYNIMQRSKCPEPYSKYFAISGWVSRPSAGASTKWSATSSRQHLDSCNRARLLFLSLERSTIEVTINSQQSRTFEIEPSESLREIELADNAIRSVEMKITSGHNGFIGYGAIFEGNSGVVVDNYSIRSNNGQAMLWTNPAINAQIDRCVGGYDLVILQYGLNIMQRGVSNYTRYGEQIKKMISYARECFPQAAILVMGVSDRSMKSEGRYLPMEEAPHLTRYQRQAAQESGAAFWSTYDAMQAQGGMSQFVATGWAGKDFTHINFAGGRQVAWALYDAIVAGVEQEKSSIVYREIHQPIIDSAANSLITRELLPIAK